MPRPASPQFENLGLTRAEPVAQAISAQAEIIARLRPKGDLLQRGNPIITPGRNQLQLRRLVGEYLQHKLLGHPIRPACIIDQAQRITRVPVQGEFQCHHIRTGRIRRQHHGVPVALDPRRRRHRLVQFQHVTHPRPLHRGNPPRVLDRFALQPGVLRVAEMRIRPLQPWQIVGGHLVITRRFPTVFHPIREITAHFVDPPPKHRVLEVPCQWQPVYFALLGRDNQRSLRRHSPSKPGQDHQGVAPLDTRVARRYLDAQRDLRRRGPAAAHRCQDEQRHQHQHKPGQRRALRRARKKQMFI
jgi:hypothetical protein